MARPTITPIPTKHGLHFRVRMEVAPDPGTGKRRWDTRTARTEAEAERIKAEMLLGQKTSGGRMKFSDFLFNEWLPDYAERRAQSSYGKTRTTVVRWIEPTWGSLRLEDIDGRAIERGLAAIRGKGASPNRTKDIFATLVSIFNVAVSWGMLADNPCKRVRPPTARPPERPRIWTTAQMHAFFAAQHEAPWLPLWATLAGTAMRIGEVRALQWRDVVWNVPMIQVQRTFATGPDGEYVTAPKSHAGTREVQIPQELVAALREWKAEQAENAWALGLQVLDDTWVFSTPDLRRLAYTTIHYQWQAAIERAGVPFVKLHALRHKGITEQLMAGIPLKTVSARAGHSSITITANIYSHVLLEHQHAAAEVLGGLITRQRDGNVYELDERRQKTARE